MTIVHPGRLNRVIKIYKTGTTPLPNQDGEIGQALTDCRTFRAQLIENDAVATLEAPGGRVTFTRTFIINFVPMDTLGNVLEYEGGQYDVTSVSEIGFRNGLKIVTTLVQ